ncbi:MAG: C40 family peptidase [Phycisphaera sp.]|nr:MAG: C40 family peptidase [Phycisphaera sp.]
MVDVRTDLERYREIPFAEGGRDLEQDEGLDCWGLARMVCQEMTSVELPIDDSEAMARMGELTEVIDKGTPRAGDLVLMLRGTHVGACIGEYVVHISKSAGVQIMSVAAMARLRIIDKVLRPRRAK